MSSISVQDYLQTIYRLQAEQSPVATTALAAQLNVAPASVTGMIRKLHSQGLVEHQPYRGVILTAAGEREALRLLRRHRLWELFLAQVLGLSWDEVHEEAHRLEHATSERVAERLAYFLDEPETDPHGHRIPARDGQLPSRSCLSIAEMASGQRAQVAEVPDDDPALLRQLAHGGLVPGASLIVLGWEATGQAIRLQVGDREEILNAKVARWIRVVPNGG